LYANPLEFLAKRFQNVVKYDADGNPSIFVKFPKMKSSELDGSLPDHTHPAFIINGVERDYILIGKYKGAELTKGGTVYSLPNLPPVHGVTYDDALARMRAAGDGVSGMTIADHGFIALLALKLGWSPLGNTEMGADIRYRAKNWHSIYRAIEVGTEVCYYGRLYTCIRGHTKSDVNDARHRPDIDVAYWQAGALVGGTVTDKAILDASQVNPAVYTLNGSGPAEWYFGGDMSGISDLVGSVKERVYGFRVVNGELQILPDNDAADPTADMSATSSAWRAIKAHAGDDGYDLVEPGTLGTVRWHVVDDDLNSLMLTAEERAGIANWSPRAGSYFQQIGWKKPTPTSGYTQAPYILKELGLFPTDSAWGSELAGRFEKSVMRRDTEYMACVGGTKLYESLMQTEMLNGRNKAFDDVGCRPRAME